MVIVGNIRRVDNIMTPLTDISNRKIGGENVGVILTYEI